MSTELRPRLLVDGHLEEIMGTCIDQAEKTFKERWGIDTNPRIVQMVHQGEPIEHYFYVSDDYISQPYLWPELFIQPFVGKTDEIEANRYNEKRYLYGEEEQLITQQLIEELSK